MKIRIFLPITFFLCFFNSCSCIEDVQDQFISTEAELRKIQVDTVYIVYDEKFFEKKEFNLKRHPSVDSIFQINFILKNERISRNLYWLYYEQAIKFSKDSVFLKPTNNFQTIRRDQVKNDYIIDPVFLMTSESRTIYFLLQEKTIIFLEEKKSCTYNSYKVGFGNYFSRFE